MGQEIGKRIVKIVDNVSKFYGTGFFIQVEGYETISEKFCITCHHCIAPLNEIFVEQKNQKFPATWLGQYSDMSKDIAVLRVENCPIESINYHREAIPKIDVCVRGFLQNQEQLLPEGRLFEDLVTSSEFTLIEFPQEEVNFSNTWNEIPKVSLNAYTITGSFNKGLSGSPVYNKNSSKVIGMFAARDNYGGFVIPIETILKKMRKEIFIKIEDLESSSLNVSLERK